MRLVFLITFFWLIRSVAGIAQSVPNAIPGEFLVMVPAPADSVLRQLPGLQPVRCLVPALHIWLLKKSGPEEDLQLLAMLQKDPRITLAQLNYRGQSRTNDPQFGQQWHLQNTGQNGGVAGDDIHVTSAWNNTTGGITAGGDTIVAAIVDGGADLQHQDLSFQRNYAEIPGDSLDNDSNGYVDDYAGWSGVTHNDVIPADYHGTHVSGIAGAIGNNGLGVSGVNWHVKLLPVSYGITITDAVAVEVYGYVLALKREYLQSHGAKGEFVVCTNSSFGIDWNQGGIPANHPLWCAMYDSLGTAGILNTAATANANWDIDTLGDMPTACASDFMVSVTNTMTNDARNPGAAYGAQTIDLGAPGTLIYSTLPNNQYGNLTGTSMASPMVAGAIALLYSMPCTGFKNDYQNDPAGTALLVKQWLLQGVDPVPDLNGKTVSGGRLNVYNSLVLGMQHYGCNAGVKEAVVSDPFEALVYPNPAGEETRLQMICQGDEHLDIQLKNLLGGTVLGLQEQVTSPGLFEKYISLSGLPSGVYMLELKTGGSLFSKRIVKY